MKKGEERRGYRVARDNSLDQLMLTLKPHMIL